MAERAPSIRALRVIGLIMLALGVPAAAQAPPPAGAQGPRPTATLVQTFGFDKVTSLEEANKLLVELHESGAIDGPERSRLARELEPRLRSNLVEGIRHDVARRTGGQIDHSGTPPTAPPGPNKTRGGGGVQGDIDYYARTQGAYDDFVKSMREATGAKPRPVNAPPGAGNFVAQDMIGTKFEELNVTVFKPKTPRLLRPEDAIRAGEAGARNTDWAPSMQAGAGPVPQAKRLRAVLENCGKGCDKLAHDLPHETWAAQADLIEASKDVLRAMQAAGVCDQPGNPCAQLAALRTEGVYPKEVGIMPKGKGYEAFQGQLKQKLGAAYREGERVFEREFNGLHSQLEQAALTGDKAAMTRLAPRLKEMLDDLGVMQGQFDVLSGKNPGLMKSISGGKESWQFIKEANDRIRKLQAPRRVLEGLSRLDRMNVVLNAGLFIECMTRRYQTMPQAGRLLVCSGEAAAGYMAGKGVSRVLVTILSETGIRLAEYVMVGTTVVLVAVQFMGYYWDYLETKEFERNADRAEREAVLTQEELRRRQEAHTKELQARLGAEEGAIGQAVQDVRTSRADILAALRTLGEQERALLSEMNTSLPLLAPLLDDLRRTMQPACDKAAGNGPAPADVTRAEAAEERVESLLNSAIELATACPNAAALTRADQAYQGAREAAAEVDRLAGARAPGGQTAGASTAAIRDKRVQLAQALNVRMKLRDGRQNGLRMVSEFLRLQARFKLLNEELTDQIEGLKTELYLFKAQFTPEVRALPVTAGRIQKMEADVASLKVLDETDLAAVDRVNTELATVNLRIESRLTVDVERLLNDLASCQTRVGAAGDDVVDRLDTARTLAQLALFKLGREFERARARCAAKIPDARAGTNRGTGVAPPAKPPAKPQPNQPLLYPAYLFHIVREEKEFNTTLFKGLPRKDDQGAYLLGDGYGGVYHVTGQYAGPYTDTAGLCAALRSVGQQSTTYFGMQGPDSVVMCDKDGPSAAPAWNRSAAAGPGTGGTPPRSGGSSAGRASGSSVGGVAPATGAAPVTISSASGPGTIKSSGGIPRPVASGDTVTVGSTLRTSAGGNATLNLRGGHTARVGENATVTIAAPPPPKKAPIVEIAEGDVDVDIKPEPISAFGPKPEGRPSFDDVRDTRSGEDRIQYRTGETTSTDDGTRFRIEAHGGRTVIKVFEGRVHVEGPALCPVSASSTPPGPCTQVRNLVAGDQVVGLAQMPAGSPPKPGIPSWANPGGAPPQPPPPRPPQPLVSPLSRPDPWNDPQVQQLMDSWLNQAVVTSTSGIEMRYNQWAQPLSRAARSTGNPDHPADWTRFRYLWETRTKWTSDNVCRMSEFIERSIAGKGLADCITGAPNAARPPSARGAGADARGASPAPPPVAPPRSTAPLPGLIGRLAAIPMDRWNPGRADIAPGHLVLLAYAAMPEALLEQCARDSAKLGIVFLGLNERPRDPSLWPVLPSYPVAFGPEANRLLRDLVAIKNPTKRKSATNQSGERTRDGGTGEVRLVHVEFARREPQRKGDDWGLGQAIYDAIAGLSWLIDTNGGVQLAGRCDQLLNNVRKR